MSENENDDLPLSVQIEGLLFVAAEPVAHSASGGSIGCSAVHGGSRASRNWKRRFKPAACDYNDTADVCN